MCVWAWVGSNCNKGEPTQNEKNKERMWAQVGSTYNKRPQIERRCDPKCVQPTTKDHQQPQFDTGSTCNILKWPSSPRFDLQQKETNKYE